LGFQFEDPDSQLIILDPEHCYEVVIRTRTPEQIENQQKELKINKEIKNIYKFLRLKLFSKEIHNTGMKF